MPRIEPFVLILIDRDTKKFCVLGPLVDDRPWNDAVCDAQKSGRNINCHTPGGDARSNIDVAGESFQRSNPEMECVAAEEILQISQP